MVVHDLVSFASFKQKRASAPQAYYIKFHA
jgi:hypothetical protein